MQAPQIDCVVPSSSSSTLSLTTAAYEPPPGLLARCSSVGRRKAEIAPPRYFDKARSCNCINVEANAKSEGQAVTAAAAETSSVKVGRDVALVRWFSDNSLNQRWVQARQKVANAYHRRGLEPKELLKYKLKTHVGVTNLVQEKDRNRNQWRANEGEGSAEYPVRIDYTSAVDECSFSVRNRFARAEGGRKVEFFLGCVLFGRDVYGDRFCGFPLLLVRHTRTHIH